MKIFLLFLWTSIACENKEKTTQKSTEQKSVVVKDESLKGTQSNKDEKTSQSNDSQVKGIIDTLIKDNKLDLTITKFEVKNKDTQQMIIEGTAVDNATISTLIQGLEKDKRLQKVYLEKTVDGKDNNVNRKVFSMLFSLASK